MGGASSISARTACWMEICYRDQVWHDAGEGDRDSAVADGTLAIGPLLGDAGGRWEFAGAFVC